MPEKKTKILISFLVIVVFVTMVTFVFMVRVINSNNGISSEKMMEIKGEKEKAETYLLLKKDLKESGQNISELDKYIIQSNGVVEFMDYLEKMALNNGLKYEVKSASFEPIIGGNFTNTELIRIELSVIGEWKNTEYFLGLLENYPLKLTLNRVSLNRFSDYVIKGKKVPQWLENIDFTVVKNKDK